MNEDAVFRAKGGPSLLDNFKRTFERRRAERKTLRYDLRSGATEEELDAAERRLGLALPQAVRGFYSAFNGLFIQGPQALEILEAGQLELDSKSNLVPFARIYRAHLVCFDTKVLNQAGQWPIVFARTGHHITDSIGSFLSNKLWKFVDSDDTRFPSVNYLSPSATTRSPHPGLPRLLLILLCQ
ncbi:MAG: SMI1/KNR4 family protein [Myxococcales bacterium]